MVLQGAASAVGRGGLRTEVGSVWHGIGATPQIFNYIAGRPDVWNAGIVLSPLCKHAAIQLFSRQRCPLSGTLVNNMQKSEEMTCRVWSHNYWADPLVTLFVELARFIGKQGDNALP